MKNTAKSQGSLIRDKNLNKNFYNLNESSYTKILDSVNTERQSLIVQFKGNGEGTVLVKFNENDSDDLALRFNNADLISELMELPSKYSGDLFAKSESGILNVLVIDSVSQY